MTLLILGAFLSVQLWGETPPEPEYPYPKQTPKTSQSVKDLEQPERTDPHGTYYYSTDSVNQDTDFAEGIEKPKKVGRDGTYYYGPLKEDEQPAKNLKGTEQPTKEDKKGAYYYDEKTASKPNRDKLIGEQPTKMEEDGTFFYDEVQQLATRRAALRFGALTAPNISADVDNGLDFEKVYSSDPMFGFMMEFDWLITDDSYVKVATGLTVASGIGQFVNDSELTPRETFQFYLMPNMASYGYRLRVSEDPLFVPYIEGGAGYFTFVESLMEEGRYSFGGALVVGATAGLQISITKHSRDPALFAEYGIKQMWLDIQIRQLIGLDERKDFTSQMFNAGLVVGF